jgi:hypothetical protein
MEAQRTRRLLLAAAAGALLASGAAASTYYLDTFWRYGYGPWIYTSLEPKIMGDERFVYVTSYDDIEEMRGVLVDWFTAEGKYVTSSEICIISGGGGTVTTRGFALYGPWSMSLLAIDYEALEDGSMLVLEGGWEERSETWGDFQALAAVPGSPDYYCYRFYDGAMRVCRSPGTAEVTSYFTPPESVRDMAAVAGGNVYLAFADSVAEYDPAGTQLRSWLVPGWLIRDVAVDPVGRVLVLTEDTYTYVYSSAGSLLSSFTVPYQYPVWSAAMGPDDKYYVLSCPYGPSNAGGWVYRFAPGPTNVLPTSLGKIKAIYN